MSRRLAFLGPAGTFTEEAALRHDPQAHLVPFSTVSAVAAAVDTGMADEGVVAIENSLEGSVPDTLDLLIHESALVIRQEIVLPIRHHLMAKAGTRPEEIRVIYSHPNALGQCRRFLERCFPKAQLVASLSTAAAVQDALAFASPAAALAPERAAQVYGASILARGVQDSSINETRFVVLAREDHQPTGRDKTSLCFSVDEDRRSGVLVNVLQEFSSRQISLTKIESRPSKEGLGKYVFLVDLEGHRLDGLVAEALDAVRRKAAMFKVFGSYPRFADEG